MSLIYLFPRRSPDRALEEVLVGGVTSRGVPRSNRRNSCAQERKGECNGENLQPRHDGGPLFAAGEGQESRPREQRYPSRRRGIGAVLARHGQGRVPHGGANSHRHHKGEALVATLARGGGPTKGADSIVPRERKAASTRERAGQVIRKPGAL